MLSVAVADEDKSLHSPSHWPLVGPQGWGVADRFSDSDERAGVPTPTQPGSQFTKEAMGEVGSEGQGQEEGENKLHPWRKRGELLLVGACLVYYTGFRTFTSRYSEIVDKMLDSIKFSFQVTIIIPPIQVILQQYGTPPFPFHPAYTTPQNFSEQGKRMGTAKLAWSGEP